MTRGNREETLRNENANFQRNALDELNERKENRKYGIERTRAQERKRVREKRERTRERERDSERESERRFERKPIHGKPSKLGIEKSGKGSDRRRRYRE